MTMRMLDNSLLKSTFTYSHQTSILPTSHVHLGLVAKVEDEVDKLVKAGFISEVHYTIWLENVLLVKKKMVKSQSTSFLGL